MKALTLLQPHAQLVALRAKPWETRSWLTHYRGPLAIHASREFRPAARALCRREPFATALLGNEDLPLGCVVAIAELTAVVPTVRERDSLFGPVEDFTERDRAFGDFRPGRFAWQLVNVRALEEPVPARGALGLWEWDERAAAAELSVENAATNPRSHLIMKKTSIPQYRQGDVLIERIDRLPAELTKQRPEQGRIILAHGEVTGHAHAFAAAAADKFTGPKGEEFFEVRGEEIAVRLPLVRAWRSQVMVQHPTLGILEFAAADVKVRGGMVTIRGRFGLLQHDEHATQAIPAGLYRGGSAGVVRQREYSPEEIRTVAD